MERSEIIAITKRFLEDEFEINPNLISDEKNMHETLELDSLDYVDLVVVIDDNFGFKPTADDLKGVQTFEDFYKLVEQKLELA